MPRTIDLIVHSKAAADVPLMAAVEEMRRRGHTVTEELTDGSDAAARLAEVAARRGSEAVIAAGGDGTLNEVLHGVVRAGVPVRSAVGIVPLGTANDFAAGCRIPVGDPLAALELIANTPAVPIDLGRLGDRLFVNVASGGFGSEVTAGTPDGLKKLLGGAAYALTGLVSWGSIQAKPVRVAGPGLAYEGKLYVLAVGNGRQAGGGFRLCDRALLDDGLFDVLTVPEVPLQDMLGLLGELMAAGAPPADAEHLRYHRVPWLDVEAPDGMQFNLDGEPHQGTAFRFEVLPRHVPFFLPPDAPLVRNRPPAASE